MRDSLTMFSLKCGKTWLGHTVSSNRSQMIRSHALKVRDVAEAQQIVKVFTPENPNFKYHIMIQKRLRNKNGSIHGKAYDTI